MIGAARAFIMANLLKLAGGALVLMGALCLYLAWTNRGLELQLARKDNQIERSVSAMRVTAARIRAAAATFRANHQQRVLRIERDQDRISQESQSDYQNRIDELRRRVAALSLRERPGAAGGGAGGTGGAAPLSDAAGEPDGTAAQNGLPAAGLPLADAIIATEQAIQLDALQRWLRAQQGIER